jgi:DNA-directed RNA polymerase subunit omega
MLHPSYNELIEAVNESAENAEEPLINSRYSIVIAAAKRARQIIAGEEPFVNAPSHKPLSSAVEELYEGKVNIVGEDDVEEEQIEGV